LVLERSACGCAPFFAEIGSRLDLEPVRREPLHADRSPSARRALADIVPHARLEAPPPGCNAIPQKLVACFIGIIDVLAFRLPPRLVVVVAEPSLCVPCKDVPISRFTPFELIEGQHRTRRVVIHPHELDHALVRHIGQRAPRRLGRNVLRRRLADNGRRTVMLIMRLLRKRLAREERGQHQGKTSTPTSRTKQGIRAGTQSGGRGHNEAHAPSCSSFACSARWREHSWASFPKRSHAPPRRPPCPCATWTSRNIPASM